MAKRLRAIVFCCSERRSGKTTLAAMLAVAAAQFGEKNCSLMARDRISCGDIERFKRTIRPSETLVAPSSVAGNRSCQETNTACVRDQHPRRIRQQDAARTQSATCCCAGEYDRATGNVPFRGYDLSRSMASRTT
jgi:hypothetical protein